MDGDELQNILNFRRDDLTSYFYSVKMSIPSIQRFFTKLFRPSIKLALLNRSDPLKALHTRNYALMKRFFGEPFPVR